jgi:hypothetical protein
MPSDSKTQTLRGQLQQLLFSPKGGLEGILIRARNKPVQVSMAPASVDVDALSKALGRHIEVVAVPDHSPKTKQGAHPVFKLISITKIGGRVFKSNSDGQDRVKGVVASIHFAKHGEPNGVVLESGEFIHTRPHGMKQLKLRIGSKVVAHGERRMTVLGTGLIEAREVNRVPIE